MNAKKNIYRYTGPKFSTFTGMRMVALNLHDRKVHEYAGRFGAGPIKLETKSSNEFGQSHNIIRNKILNHTFVGL